MIWLGIMENTAQEKKNKNSWSEYLLFFPLILPQVAFLSAFKLCYWLRLDGSVFALIWSHMLFVIPYIWLLLLLGGVLTVTG